MISSYRYNLKGNIIINYLINQLDPLNFQMLISFTFHSSRGPVSVETFQVNWQQVYHHRHHIDLQISKSMKSFVIHGQF